MAGFVFFLDQEPHAVLAHPDDRAGPGHSLRGPIHDHGIPPVAGVRCDAE